MNTKKSFRNEIFAAAHFFISPIVMQSNKPNTKNRSMTQQQIAPMASIFLHTSSMLYQMLGRAPKHTFIINTLVIDQNLINALNLI